MSYSHRLQFQKRRHPTRHLTHQEAIAELNRLAQNADKRIAHWHSQARHFEQVAKGVEAENRELRAENEELKAENRKLELAFKKARAARRKPKKKQIRREDFEG